MKAKQRTLVVLLALLAAACGAFALLYLIVYRVTARAYYKIVE